MNFKHFFVAIFILLCWGCQSPTQQATSPPTLTSTPAPATVTPTLTVTATVTLSSTLTPTLLPTLAIAEKEAYVLDLIKVNGGCELPCIFGIVPGEARWEDLRRVDAPTYWREKYEPNDAGRLGMPFYVNQQQFGNLDLTFIGSSEYIQRIQMDANIYLSDNPYYFPKFAEAMGNFSMPTMLRKYGVPTRILMHARGEAELDGGTMAQFFLFFDDLGILLEYLYQDVVMVKPSPGSLTVCPKDEYIYYIRVRVQSPEDYMLLERMVGDKNDYFLNLFLSPLGEITDLTTQDFYNLFVELDKNPCFDVSR